MNGGLKLDLAGPYLERLRAEGLSCYVLSGSSVDYFGRRSFDVSENEHHVRLARSVELFGVLWSAYMTVFLRCMHPTQKGASDSKVLARNVRVSDDGRTL